MENPIKMNDLGVPLFLETPIYRGEITPVIPNDFRPFVGLYLHLYLERAHLVRIQICPKSPGFPRTNPMTWG